MTDHRQSLAAVHAELRDALHALTLAERTFDEARLHLEAAQARHRAASIEVINRCIEIKQISAEATATRQRREGALCERAACERAACERRSHHPHQGNPS